MDSGSHFVIGLGLGGLAYVDPIVAADPTVATAVIIGTVLGSQAPDSDGLLRFRGNAAYIKHHRGASHSLPAILIWTLLITFALSLVFSGLPMWHVAMWVLIAVSFHVFTDLFNAYGTQAFRPFTQRWISWNVIHIFDPFIFTSHCIAIILWITAAASPAYIFPILYTIIAMYYVWRTIHHHRMTRKVAQADPTRKEGDAYHLIPTVHLNTWNIVKQSTDGVYTIGEMKQDDIRWIDQVSCEKHPAIDRSLEHPDIAAFLYFTSFACAEVQCYDWGYKVRWADIRYRHRKQYPFVAVLHLDLELNPLESYVGWVSESRLQKKLRIDSY